MPMKDDKKINPESKKGLPGGFLLFIIAIVLLIVTMQSLTSDKMAKVSFNHQVEHLVNLNMIQPENSRKFAENDNLVTFLGSFRENETPEGKERFKYLDLLNNNHELQAQEQKLDGELKNLRKQAISGADLFLQVQGGSLPRGGFVLVGPGFDTTQQINSIVIQSVEPGRFASLYELRGQLSMADLNETARQAALLLEMLKAPNLGIVSLEIKTGLGELDTKLGRVAALSDRAEKAAGLNIVLQELSVLMTDMTQPIEGARLMGLQSVRSYVNCVDQYIALQTKIEKNRALLDKARQSVGEVVWFFNNQELSTRALEQQDSEVYAQWFAQAKKEWQNLSSNKGLAFKAPDQMRNTVLDKTFKSEAPPPNYLSYLFTFLPFILIGLLLYFVFAKQMKGVGSSAMNFGKSPAKLLTKESNKVTFKDVAGAEEAKEELSEIVDFLKDPQKFTALGARIPKGVLLVGPPGTGKTLIAKAVAGEADRPFYSISGSDFVEMFVGVGASRVRDLFEQGKKNAPCIIFMDEIDAVGRHRGAGIGGGHDEREQTLNQLLVEMDGFDTKEGVILVAATNRPDILDKALLRPGRFDRRVSLDLPDVKGRFEILKVHARKIKIDPSVELMEIARNTPGASGADLENILNESALLAARRGRSAVTAVEAAEACDKVRFGKERRSLEMDVAEKQTTAFHESGHAIVGLKVEHCDPIDKVTIIPRGFSLGATHFMPKKNRLSYWKKEVLDQLIILLGGRAAEEVFVDDLSSGAQQDITQATRLARAMVCEWGMTDSLGTVTYDERQEGGAYLGMPGYHEKSYSNETAQEIDKEVRKLIDEAHEAAKQIILNNKDKVQLMTDMLMEFETLDSVDVKEIMEGSWSADEKRKRLKMADELQRSSLPPKPSENKLGAQQLPQQA